MIVLDCEQGSEAWLRARIGLPTASGFDQIMTAKKLQYSESAAKYRAHILAEWTTGFPIQDDLKRNDWMARGTDMEPEARRWYELEKDVEVERVGFILREDRRVGGSPDGLVGLDGGAEIKVPALHTHLLYLLDPKELVAKYQSQCQGYMYLTGRKWWDVLSYSPVVPKVLERIPRDPQFIGALHRHIGRFLTDLDAAKRKLLVLGCNPPEWIQRPEPEGTHEALIDQMYGPEPVVDSEPFEAMPSELLRLKQLASLHEDLTTDDRLTIQHVIEKRDGHGVQAWTRKLEREVAKRVPAA